LGPSAVESLRKRSNGASDLGYVQGRNIVLLHRLSDPQPEKIEDAIISLVPQVDLLVVWGNAGMPVKN